MNKGLLIFTVAIGLFLGACSTQSASTVMTQTALPAWTGPVFISQETIPADIKFELVGSVKANARAGYDNVASLYPLLAIEAKKMGANAVINAKGGRRVAAFSWAAAYVDGMAIRVEDPELLKTLPGAAYY